MPDFLDQRGILPERRSGGKHLIYNCFLPGHDESVPSCYVRVDISPHLFYCFGCQRGGTLVDLIHHLDGLSIGQAIRKLGGGKVYTEDDRRLHEIEKISKIPDLGLHVYDISSIMILMSSKCRRFLEAVNYDPEECAVVDKFWAAIDHSIMVYSFDEFRKMLTNLKCMLYMRLKKHPVYQASRWRRPDA